MAKAPKSTQPNAQFGLLLALVLIGTLALGVVEVPLALVSSAIAPLAFSLLGSPAVIGKRAATISAPVIGVAARSVSLASTAFHARPGDELSLERPIAR